MSQARMRTAVRALVRWLHAMLQAVQQIVEDRLMSLREDMQASQQQVTGQFAQHQVWHHIMHAVLMQHWPLSLHSCSVTTTMTLHGYFMTMTLTLISGHSCHAAAQTQSLLMFADRALHTVYLHLSTVQCVASS